MQSFPWCQDSFSLIDFSVQEELYTRQNTSIDESNLE
jgi:hypothetical protein